MSRPLWVPRPVYVPFSGTCDANGNLTINLPALREAFWTATKCIARASAGNPTWEVLAGGAPLEFGRGQRISIGSIILPPSGAPSINVIGAAPSAAVIGAFIGAEASSQEEVVARSTLTPSTVAADTTPPLTQFMQPITGVDTTFPNLSFTIGAGLDQKFTFNVAPTAKALRIVGFIVPRNISTFTYTMRVYVGTDIAGPGATPGILWPQSNAEGTQTAPLFPARPVIIPLDSAWAGALITGPYQVTVEITGDPANKLGFVVSALFDIESVDVWSQLPLTVSGSGTFTVQEGTSPPLWQAPRANAFAQQAGIGVSNLVPAVAGQIVRVFGGLMDVPSPAAAATVQLEDTASTILFAMQAGSAATSITPELGPLGLGLGLQLRVVVAGATARWGGGYSQG